MKAVSDISDGEIREQYRMFCHSLAKVVIKKEWNNSRDILKHFLSTKHNLYKGIELVMQISCCAAVKLSTESVLESKVGIFERHFHKGRPLKEPQMIAEMEVATNGPTLVEADNILETAMKNYFDGGRWHFVKRCDIRDYGQESLVLKRLKSEKSKLTFMVEN